MDNFKNGQRTPAPQGSQKPQAKPQPAPAKPTGGAGGWQQPGNRPKKSA